MGVHAQPLQRVGWLVSSGQWLLHCRAAPAHRCMWGVEIITKIPTLRMQKAQSGYSGLTQCPVPDGLARVDHLSGS